jgi:hypothetical protein
MKRFLPLLMLTGLLFGQDVLTHKSGKIYKGKYYGIVEQTIVFYVEGETSNKMFPIREVTSIETDSSSMYWAQTDFDILILKSGTTYFGEYSKIEGEIVYFKPQNALAFQPISIKQIQTLKLKDGHFIIGDGKNILTFSNINDEYQKENIKDSEVIFYLFCSIISVVFIVFIVKEFKSGLSMSGYDAHFDDVPPSG